MAGTIAAHFRTMRSSNAHMLVLLVCLIGLFVLAVLGWIRPVRIVQPEEARMVIDSLLRVSRNNEARAVIAERDADYWREAADSLAAARTSPERFIKDARMGIEVLGVNTAALDSLRKYGMAEPR